MARLECEADVTVIKVCKMFENVAKPAAPAPWQRGAGAPASSLGPTTDQLIDLLALTEEAPTPPLAAPKVHQPQSKSALPKQDVAGFVADAMACLRLSRNAPKPLTILRPP
jgi:hypothetical protein